MQGTFAFPFAEAESVMLTLARDLDAQADAMVAPAGFQGRTARALAGAQAERRATLNQLSESAFEAASISGNQNTADEALAAAPSPEVVATQEGKVRAMTAALDAGIGSVAAVMYENRILDDLLMRRQLALTVHAAESERSTGCFGRLDIPPVAGRSGDGGGDMGEGLGHHEGGFNPKRTTPGSDAPSPSPTDEAPPPPDNPDAPAAPEAPISVGPSISGGPSVPSAPDAPASEVSDGFGGGMPLVPATGLSGGGMPVPQSPMMQPMQMPMQQPMPGGGMPGAGGFGFPMPAGIPPVPGAGFTAPQSGRQLDPLPKTRNRETTKEDLDLALFPTAVDGGIPAAAPAAVAGVGAAIAGAVTQANTTGITPPVVSAMPPANPMSGTPGGPYGGGGMAPMAPMGSGAGMAAGGSIVKREPILAADGGTVAAESLRESVANGLIGRATAATVPPPERAAS